MGTGIIRLYPLTGEGVVAIMHEFLKYIRGLNSSIRELGEEVKQSVHWLDGQIEELIQVLKVTNVLLFALVILSAVNVYLHWKLYRKVKP